MWRPFRSTWVPLLHCSLCPRERSACIERLCRRRVTGGASQKAEAAAAQAAEIAALKAENAALKAAAAQKAEAAAAQKAEAAGAQKAEAAVARRVVTLESAVGANPTLPKSNMASDEAKAARAARFALPPPAASAPAASARAAAPAAERGGDLRGRLQKKEGTGSRDLRTRLSRSK